MNTTRHILINALSMGGGGGFTVGREVTRHLGLQRGQWKITCALIEGNRLHEQMRAVSLPTNAELLWAPVRTIGRRERSRWERQDLTQWAEKNGVDAVVQLNGMLVPTMRPPTLCHMQDPWPYRPVAWQGFTDRAVAFFKRRAHHRALKRAAAFTWTSEYLRTLICGYHNIWPANSKVVYNGVPDAWAERSRGQLPTWNDRPNELITVSNVSAYKRHSLVIRAIPLLLKEPGLGDLIYRIIGDWAPGYDLVLKSLAAELGVADRVRLEGRISDDEVASAYARAKCFVLMSVCESFGIPAIEAMSFGTPVVTADCCAMPEVCGDAAELVPIDDANALAARLAAVMRDPRRAEELRRRGIDRVARFNWTEPAQEMARVLERMCDAPSAANRPPA